ncbi:MAG: type II toxin-antitoxin system VapC family toxin [Solirubrobacteraceae bacterium]
MKLLLDTHAALWWLGDDDRLGPVSADLLDDASNDILLSAAVVWEVAVKRSLGKLIAPDGFASTLIGAGANALPVTIAHAEAVELLEWHHRDPFDRMLIAQAAVEQAVLVSNNQALLPYGVPLIW